MRLKVKTPAGVESELNVTEVISIDGVPFDEVAKSAGVDLDTLNTRLTIAESALAHMLEQWTEFMDSAVLVDGPAKDGE
jgi:cobalamin biosynthesis protein CbiD